MLAYDAVDVPALGHTARRCRTPGTSPTDTTFTITGHRAGAKFLADWLLTTASTSPTPTSRCTTPLGHAFVNTVLYLDWDRKGFPYPGGAVRRERYGRGLVARPRAPHDAVASGQAPEGELDPPGPQPWRCFQLGAAVARAARASPWRVALVASSSWSHSFLVAKNSLITPTWRPTSATTRRCKRRRLGDLAQTSHRGGGGPRPPRAAELVLPGRRDGRAGPQTRLLGLPRVLDHELRQGLRGVQALTGGTRNEKFKMKNWKELST